jgi:putative ABC transport system permease protein
MALGATYERVAFSVLAQGLRLVIFGAAAGTVVALLATQVIARQLYATGPRDPVVFAGVPLLLVAVAACAAGLPARRAARVDPQIALRSE